MLLSAVLGHASPAFTVAVYQHAWQDGPYEAAAALEKALGSNMGQRYRTFTVSNVSDVGNPLANKVIEAAGQRVSTAN